MPTVFPRKLLPIGVERVVVQDKFTGLEGTASRPYQKCQKKGLWQCEPNSQRQHWEDTVKTNGKRTQRKHMKPSEEAVIVRLTHEEKNGKSIVYEKEIVARNFTGSEMHRKCCNASEIYMKFLQKYIGDEREIDRKGTGEGRKTRSSMYEESLSSQNVILGFS